MISNNINDLTKNYKIYNDGYTSKGLDGFYENNGTEIYIYDTSNNGSLVGTNINSCADYSKLSRFDNPLVSDIYKLSKQYTDDKANKLFRMIDEFIRYFIEYPDKWVDINIEDSNDFNFVICGIKSRLYIERGYLIEQHKCAEKLYKLKKNKLKD